MIDISTTEFEADLNSDWIKLVTELRNKEDGVSYERRSYDEAQVISRAVQEVVDSIAALIGTNKANLESNNNDSQ